MQKDLVWKSVIKKGDLSVVRVKGIERGGVKMKWEARGRAKVRGSEYGARGGRVKGGRAKGE